MLAHEGLAALRDVFVAYTNIHAMSDAVFVSSYIASNNRILYF